MEETLLKIEDAIAGESEDSVSEWLERIRHELIVANAINLLHLTFNQNVDERLIHKHLEEAINIVTHH